MTGGDVVELFIGLGGRGWDCLCETKWNGCEGRDDRDGEELRGGW